MADAAVEFLLENLKQLIIKHADLINDAKGVAERLENNILRLFKDFIKDVPKQQRKEDERERELTQIRIIRNAVYDVEDIIDAYAIQPNKDGEIRTPLKSGNIIVDEVEAAIEKIKDIYTNRIDFSPNPITIEDGEAITVEDKEADENEVSEQLQVTETRVVGFEDEEEYLQRYICTESDILEVYSIIGMPGQGKTVLADKIFHSEYIRYTFDKHIWVYVSREFTRKDIFLAILEEFTMLTDDIKSKTDEELAGIVHGFLENESFLLVLDDLWTCEDWDKLRVALPDKNSRGRVLITSRWEQVGVYVCRSRPPYMIRSLSIEESVTLLMSEVFQDQLECPPQLEDLGTFIATNCNGHPLSIVLVGGILAKEVSTDITTMQTAWGEVYETLNMYHTEDENPFIKMPKIIRLSYEKLPYHLRECFLYFGMFPEDFEIPAWKLIRLWIAEGLVQPKNAATLEETAENYLVELINRKLVQAVKFKLDGKVKTCRIHDMLLEFGLNESGMEREGFLQEVKMSSDGDFAPPISEELKFRRLCIHSYVLNFVSGKPHGPNVRSFVCSSREEMSVPMKDIQAIPRGFKLLRVLDMEPIKFTDKLPRDMFRLLCLRYLVLSFNISVLPSAFSELWNLQTLVVNTDSRALEIRADLLSLIQLSHFKTNASAALLNTSTSREGGGENLQTLGTISPESCTKDVFERVCHLKKLGIRGKLALLLDAKNESSGSLVNLVNLEKLKLLNDVFLVQSSGVTLRGLPPPSQFPPNLKVLTLSRTLLDWSHMSVIACLEKLEVLKLKDKALVGEIWEVTDGGFRNLQVLLIQRTNLKNWSASHHHFPSLKHLMLKHCDELQEVPSELADVPSFRKLDLFYSKQAASSAMEMERIKKNQFMLSIFPSPMRNYDAASS